MLVETKERPILFSGPMVRAILEGRKTQTRRVAKTSPSSSSSTGHFVHLSHGRSIETDERALPFCPYGQPGDRLWVRETWAKAGEVGDDIEYRADNPDPLGAKWRPSIHMPRWASRITLEITGVRVERLTSISSEDARAEGIEWNEGPFRCGHTNHVSAFKSVWESINGKGSWSADPWVWVIDFKPQESH